MVHQPAPLVVNIQPWTSEHVSNTRTNRQFVYNRGTRPWIVMFDSYPASEPPGRRLSVCSLCFILH